MEDISREELIFMAKISQEAGKSEDTIKYMKKVINFEKELTASEIQLFYLAYNNTINPRRAALYKLTLIEEKEIAKEVKLSHLRLLRKYKWEIEAEMDTFCEEVLEILDQILIPASKENAESLTFFSRMKGDFSRYICEYTHPERRNKIAKNALQAYEIATEVAFGNFSAIHPFRLGLASSFSVFYYEILSDVKKACKIANGAIDLAMENDETLEEGKEDLYKEACVIIQGIRRNLDVWTFENYMEEDDDLL